MSTSTNRSSKKTGQWELSAKIADVKVLIVLRFFGISAVYWRQCSTFSAAGRSRRLKPIEDKNFLKFFAYTLIEQPS